MGWTQWRASQSSEGLGGDLRRDLPSRRTRACLGIIRTTVARTLLVMPQIVVQELRFLNALIASPDTVSAVIAQGAVVAAPPPRRRNSVPFVMPGCSAITKTPLALFSYQSDSEKLLTNALLAE